MFKRIPVALDSTEQSHRVMDSLLQLHMTEQTVVVLLHVIPVSESSLEQPADRPSIDPELGEFRHIEKELQQYQSQLSCQTELEIVSGDPAEEIIRVANIHQVDLVILGSRGLTGVNRILQGSVSSQVVSDSPCTVMVVKPTEH